MIDLNMSSLLNSQDFSKSFFSSSLEDRVTSPSVNMRSSLLTSQLSNLSFQKNNLDPLPMEIAKDVEMLLVSPPAGILSSAWAQDKLRLELSTKTGITELPTPSPPKKSPYTIGVPSSPTLTYQEITSKGGVLSKQNVFPQPFKLFDEIELDPSSRKLAQHPKIVNTPAGEVIFH